MKLKNFNKIIENEELKNRKERAWEKVSKDIGYPPKKSSPAVKRAILLTSILSVVLVCLFLPIILNSFNNSMVGENSSSSISAFSSFSSFKSSSEENSNSSEFFKSDSSVGNRFCDTNDCIMQGTEKNLVDLANEMPDLLYFDWEEFEATTNYYVHVEDLTTIGIDEVVYNINEDLEVSLIVVFPGIEYSPIEQIRENTQFFTEIEGVKIYWFRAQTSCDILFDYKGYTYRICVLQSIDEVKAISLVTSLLNSRK